MLGCIQPMSSPMMKRILGLSCCCAAAGALAAIATTNDASRPRQTFLLMLLTPFCRLLPEPGRQPAPVQHFREERCGPQLHLGAGLGAVRGGRPGRQAAARSSNERRANGSALDPLRRA